MSPAIHANSYLIFHHCIFRRILTVGTMIKVQHPKYGLIIKRIKSIDHQGCYWLEGLNENSVSATQMGIINLRMITGIVIYTIKAPFNNPL